MSFEGFEGDEGKAIASEARRRRKVLKEFFKDKPRYVTEVQAREFLSAHGIVDWHFKSIHNDMKHFGYVMTKSVYSPRDREAMSVTLRNGSGDLVKTWVYVNAEQGYSDDSYHEFFASRFSFSLKMRKQNG